MNRDALKQWCRLQDFLNAPSDSADDAAARLAADGVDVDGAVDRIKSMVRKAYQADLRSQAEAERTQSDRRAAIVREKVASMSLDAVRHRERSAPGGGSCILQREISRRMLGGGSSLAPLRHHDRRGEQCGI
jgi:hypothetical protein